MSWNADRLTKQDADQALMERITELQGIYRGLPHDDLNMNRFQRQLTRLIVDSGYPPMKVREIKMEGRLMLGYDGEHVVPVPAPLQLQMTEGMAEKLQL